MVTSESNSSVQALNVHYRESEQKTLLMLKDGFHNSLGRFSLWVPKEDCCKWKGVGCNNEIDNVISLNLHSPDSSKLLQGSISHGFGNLTSLAVLDFSYNYLMGSIPHNFGNMTSLIVLDLSYSVLEVPILATLKSDSTIAPLQTFTLTRTSSFLQ
ncbi:hypothetical protein GH714_018631 [Hevea brasiliensis]|uniref:Leucine-rich repeat-containing N-terminal plant-type domain-containing protein n=1 Tax=Hevea brasiliensis TaxID=3981 RepID=A0A6A6N5D6_HEVBR|nr:hypothetical protein GH714_018631 [Hevea brasiliensis]